MVSVVWDPLEKEFDYQLFNSKKGLAPMLGWRPALTYHTLRSKGSQSGFPDRVLVRERVIFAELKREKGKPTEAQIEWLDGLAAAGAEVYLWRPSDLEEIGRILSRRQEFRNGDLGTPADGWWVPFSLWIGGSTSGHRP